MRTFKASLLSLSLIAALSSTAAAQTVNFDDVTTSPVAWLGNYSGLTWSNAYVMNGLTYFGSSAAAGGITSALSSGSYTLGNGGGNALGVSGSSFNLLSGVFAAGWRDGVTLTAIGSSNGVQLYNQSYTIDWDKAQSLSFNMFGVDNVVFTTTGGTVDGRFNSGSNAGFAADDFVFGESNIEQSVSAQVDTNVVPEPMTMSLMGAGLMVLGAASARRRRVIAK